MTDVAETILITECTECNALYDFSTKYDRELKELIPVCPVCPVCLADRNAIPTHSATMESLLCFDNDTVIEKLYLPIYCDGLTFHRYFTKEEYREYVAVQQKLDNEIQSELIAEYQKRTETALELAKSKQIAVRDSAIDITEMRLA